MNCFASMKRHSSTILSILAAVGTIATAVLTVLETPKACELLEVAEEEKSEKLTKIEVLKIAGPVYLPAAGVGLSTIACIFGASILNRRHQASLASAYALLDGLYKEYRGKVIGLFGEEADHIITRSIDEDRQNDGEDRPGFEEKQLFYEDHKGEFFERTMRDVIEAEYHINRNLVLRGSVTLNEFYDFLGLSHIQAGDEIGWNLYDGEAFYGYSWIDFSHRYFETDDGLMVCAIDMPFAPHSDQSYLASRKKQILL